MNDRSAQRRLSRPVLLFWALALLTLISSRPAGAESRSTQVGAAVSSAAPWWPGWDIARGVALRHGAPGGYVLDGWGGIHPFGGAPSLAPSEYHRGVDFARGIALQGDNRGGIVARGDASLLSFGTPGTVARLCFVAATSSTVPGAPDGTVRGVSLDPTYRMGTTSSRAMGIEADGAAGFSCGRPEITSTGLPSFQWPIVRGVAVAEGGGGGFVLDGYGGLHAFGNARLLSATAYWPGWDIARGAAVDGHGHGVVIDGFGGLHPFTYALMP